MLSSFLRGNAQIPGINFAPTGSVQQMSPEAYLTPQEKYLMAKKQQAQAPGTPAGGVPGQGGGGAPAPATDATAILGGGVGGGGASGLMASIMKMLPMLAGGA